MQREPVRMDAAGIETRHKFSGHGAWLMFPVTS
jgi:hypothetical protein